MKGFRFDLRGVLNSISLNKAQKLEFKKEQDIRIVNNMKFMSVAVLVVVLLYGVIDYFIVNDKQIYWELNQVRLGFVLLFLIPFIIYFSKNSKQVPPIVLLVNAMGYGIYLFSLSFIANSNMQAVFHNTVGVFMLNIMLFVLFGLKRKYAILVSGFLFFLISINFKNIGNNGGVSIQLFDVALWYAIVTVIGLMINIHIESIHIRSFKSNWELKQMNQSRYKLFSVVSHDLKNIISSQSTITDYLQNTHAKLDAEELEKMLGLLNKSSTDASDLFEDLMTWIKSQLDIIKPELSFFDFGKFIDYQIDQFAFVAESKKIQFDKSGVELEDIKSDATILSLVFRNIVSNAIKYSNENSTIEIKALRKLKALHFEISDSGSGIDADHIKKLFSFDKLASKKGTKGEQGTGMGLVLTKELLDHINGEIKIESVKGEGTSVFINIPEFYVNPN